MPRFELWYEAQPWVQTQAWGIRDSFYERFGFKLHNGRDFALGYNARLRAPIPCVVTKIGWQENGAGLYICLLTLNEWSFDDGKTAKAELTYMHLDHTVAKVGQILDIGTLFAIGDNTGVSTGPHTHLAPKRVRSKTGGYVEIDKNDAKNTFNDAPYRNGLYAVDYKKPVTPAVTVETTLKEARASLENIATVPEPQRNYILEVWINVLSALSKLLTKG